MCTKCEMVVEELHGLGFESAVEGPRHGSIAMSESDLEELVNETDQEGLETLIEELHALGAESAEEGPKRGFVTLSRSDTEDLIDTAFPEQENVNEAIEERGEEE